MAKYVSFHSNGNLFQFGSLKKDLAAIKTIKEVGGVKAFSITANQYNLLNAGQTASESGGIITVSEPAGWLANYKAKNKDEQKQIGIALFKDYRDNIGNSDADIATYKTSLKSCFISDVKAPINAAANKAEVDAAVAAIDWPSVVIP